MKVAYNWLKQYVNVEKSPEEMGRILTDTGLEVEGIHKMEAVKGGLERVVVGQVLTCEKHPDADRLKVTTVDTGKDVLNIVCGAPNVAAGQKVIVATVGTTLYPTPEESFKIKKSKIRGVESEGMLCAEDELGLGTSHDGILVLDPEVEIGMPAARYFELEDDYQLEIGLTPNRADAMGHIGVARDLMAYLNVHENAGLTLNLPDVSGFAVSGPELKVAVSVEDAALCPRYTGTTIRGVEVKSSPAWLQKRLRSIGLTPINNVVDVTNFVMHELGTPLHAFDAAALNGKIVVKNAGKGESFVTLDEVERKLDETNLMITNGSDPLCIAGVFGGLGSGVTEKTTDVFLESAYFNPVSVRKTAKMHGLNTDASFRFERGVDPNMTMIALKRAALLICEVAGGAIAMEPSDTHPEPFAPTQVEFSLTRCNQLIGESLTKEQVVGILKELDIVVREDNGDLLVLDVPAYRVDVLREADVIEEVLRIYGFNNVSVPQKLNTSLTYFEKPDAEKVQAVISEMLVGMGCMETMHNSLTRSEYSNNLGGEVVQPGFNVEILNPLSKDLDVMRQSLLFGILETVAHNQNRQHADLKLFEFGKVYHKYASGYEENRRLIIAVSGAKQEENWNTIPSEQTFYTIKGMVYGVLKRLGLSGMTKEKAFGKSLLQDGLSLTVVKNNVGQIGWVSPQLKKHFGIKNDVFIADLDWDKLIESLMFAKVKFTELPKTFAVRRDFSLLIDSGVSFAEIEQVAKECDKKLLQEVGLFDVYEGDKLDAGKKSYAVSFKFQDPENTLKDQQVDAIMEKIRQSLETKLGAQLR